MEFASVGRSMEFGSVSRSMEFSLITRSMEFSSVSHSMVILDKDFPDSFILLETGDKLLLEDGFFIVKEDE